MKQTLILSLLCILPSLSNGADPVKPLFTVVDLNRGETATVELSNGEKATVKILEVTEERCTLRNAVRKATVTAEIDGKKTTLRSSFYNLPVTVGKVQADCPVTGGYTKGSSKNNAWALEKDARLRLWPAGSPLIRPGTLFHPVNQRWFANDTQMCNEPVYVNACDKPGQKNVYYHYGLDFGGVEGSVSVLAATDGLVVSTAGRRLNDKLPSGVKPRGDVVYIQDGRGWYYRYSHLQSIDKSVKLGGRVKMGDKIGTLGKEGGSGGWAHLHFDIQMVQPSGKLGKLDAYPLMFEAYRRKYKPTLLAVARPHIVSWTGQPVTLDGSRSWHRDGFEKIKSFKWEFTDGKTATGMTVKRTYDAPGHYTETLKITDAGGKTSYDFVVVQVFDRAKPNQGPLAIHPAFWPTDRVRAGDEITFKVRTFGVKPDEGRETWDFGDGSKQVETRSDGNQKHHAKDGYAITTHTYRKPGNYIVKIHRTNSRGQSATGRLWVVVE